jgi:hypothetical protein
VAQHSSKAFAFSSFERVPHISSPGSCVAFCRCNSTPVRLWDCSALGDPYTQRRIVAFQVLFPSPSFLHAVAKLVAPEFKK